MMIFFPSRIVPLRWSNLWRCLADDAHSISVATAMLLTSTHLYLTGTSLFSMHYFCVWAQHSMLSSLAHRTICDAYDYVETCPES
jgi:hypothetical protein